MSQHRGSHPASEAASAQPADGVPSGTESTELPASAADGPDAAPAEVPAHGHTPSGGRLLVTLAALGVVFGDIGTSPLYAMQTLFSADHNAVQATQAHVTGAISLVLWSLVLVVTVKYVLIVLRADHHGEGGVLSLATLVRRRIDPTANRPDEEDPRRTRLARWVFGLGLVGCCFFFGDSVITPAISVMSAVEGVAVAAPSFEAYVLPATLVILVLLFGLQRFGTASVGALFGPVMLIWFLSLATLGVPAILRAPQILWALSPLPGMAFVVHEPFVALVAMGAVVLVVTGAEALYADVGHFGRRPISRGWLFLVLPALALNYLGQGALILRDPSAVANPFFELAPQPLILPLTILAIVATVIASQAVITGAYSVTRQAIRLGYLPALAVRHTSSKEAGQVYLPFVNWALLTAVVIVVLMFRSSVALATAYGLAVTITLVITTVLVLIHARISWGWPLWVLVPLGAAVAPLEWSFLDGNLVKVAEGGWLPLLIGTSMLTVMVVWRRGRASVERRRARMEEPLEAAMERTQEHLASGGLRRVPGLAVYLSPSPTLAPAGLRINLRANRALHEKVLVLHVETSETPHVPEEQRVTAERIGPVPGVQRVTVHLGFFERLDLPAVLRRHAAVLGLSHRELAQAVYVLSGTRYLPPKSRSLRTLPSLLYVRLAGLSDQTALRFRLPLDHTLEVGSTLRM